MSEVSQESVTTTRERSASAGAVGDARALQQKLVSGVLRALTFVGMLVVVAGTYESYVQQDYWTIPLYWGAYIAVVLAAWLPSVPYTLQVLALTGTLYITGVIDFFQDGRAGSGRVFLLSTPFLISLLFGLKASLAALVLITLTMGGFGVAFTQGYLPIPVIDMTDSSSWTAGTLVLFMMGALIVTANNYIVPNLVRGLNKSRELADELAGYRDSLEASVANRTADLERRSRQLATAAKVARRAAEFRDLEPLLETTVRLISDNFGFYHTGIFLLNEERTYAVLRAASSEGGRAMLARGHQLRVGEVGIVGHVTERGEPRIASDVGQDAAFFDNPYLPDTHSEMALPLRARGQIIGALDVQSKIADAFDEQDIAILQTMADQVALAITNTRLFQQLQASLDAEQQLYGKLSREAWRKLFAAQGQWTKRYDPQGILPAIHSWSKPMRRAVKTGAAVKETEGEAEVLAVPIKVRGQVIGVLNAYRDVASGGWSKENLAFLETLTDQLGQALESARLYRDTQLRAAREQFVSETTAHLRETLDLDTVLQTAAREMREGLGLAEAEVRLGIDWVAGSGRKMQTGALRRLEDLPDAQQPEGGEA